MATHKFETPERRARLVSDFDLMQEFLNRQHDVSLAQGHREYAGLCQRGAVSASKLRDDLGNIMSNPVTMFTGSIARQADLATVVKALNPILGLPEDNPARCNAAVRTAMRRTQDFIDWLYDDGNCGKPVHVAEFNLRASQVRREAAAVSVGLIEPVAASQPAAARKFPAPAPGGTVTA